MKKIYVVATPIGNINEISKRAIEILNKIKVIYCEDTRVIKKLLTLLDINLINKKFISLNGFNEKEVVEKIKLQNEFEICLVSDAGYPTISDPGFCLINFAINNNISIEIVNGPSALMHALVISGFSTNNFYFFGFLNSKKNKALFELVKIKEFQTTIIIYESVHRIIETLKNIKEVFSDDVKLIVAKELTKSNETIYRGNINKIIKEIDLRGEFVIVIDNNYNENKKEIININDYIMEVKKLVNKNNSEKIACKMVGYKYGISSKDLFNALQLKKNII
ncbi:16S rRNA (cytidine(1402)-2'-O)-methyltransferase [Malacoplasma muris]|uniref:16S rRNA (cytidine(1402)-2'-O)-methyltransferase n=1 Tax=Malacoplasma muris TaxID=2119 RepID=UPI00398E7C3E